MSIISGVKPGQDFSVAVMPPAANDQGPVNAPDMHSQALGQAGINFTLPVLKTSGEEPAQFTAG